MPQSVSSLVICLLPYTLVAIRDIMAAPSAPTTINVFLFALLLLAIFTLLLCSALLSAEASSGPYKRKERKMRRIFSPILYKSLNSQGFLSFNLPRVKRHYVSRVILSNNKLRETTPLTTWNEFDEQKSPAQTCVFTEGS